MILGFVRADRFSFPCPEAPKSAAGHPFRAVFRVREPGHVGFRMSHPEWHSYQRWCCAGSDPLGTASRRQPHDSSHLH